MSFTNKLIIHNTLHNIDSITGRQFEFYTAYLFKLLNYHNIKVTRATGDYGIDVICNNPVGNKIGIQCKHISNNHIGYRAVEEAVSGCKYYKLNIPIVLTNQSYTHHAINSARHNHVKLLGRNWLIHILDILIHKNLKQQGTKIIQYLSPKRIRNIRKCNDNKKYQNIAYNLHKHMSSIQQVWVIDWLTNNMRITTNKLRCTYTELQKETNVSRLSISKTYKILRNMGMAKFRRGHVFINPVLMMRGSDSRYIRIYNDYYFSNQDWWKHLDTNDEFSNE